MSPLTLPPSSRGVQTDVLGGSAPSASSDPSGPRMRPVGGSMDLEVISGIQGLVASQRAVLQEMQDTARSIQTMAEKASRFFDDALSSSRQSMSMLAQGQAQALGFGRNAAIPPSYQVASYGGNMGAAPPSTNAAQFTNPVITEAMSATEQIAAHQASQAAAHREKRTEHEEMLSNLLGRGRGGSYTRAPEEGSPPDPSGEARPPGSVSPVDAFRRHTGDPIGSIRGMAGNIIRGWGDRMGSSGQRLEQNTAGQWIDSETGHFVSAKDAARFVHREQTIGRVKKFGDALKSEEGSVTRALGEALPELAPIAELAGPIAAAGLLGREGLHQVVEQRAENARWQQIYGGSNYSQFGQRAQQKVFEWGQMGFMGAGQAGQLFQGVSALGLKGAQRQQGLQFGIQNYSRYGMNVEDSVQLVADAVSSGVTNLSGLSTALDNVSKTAKGAGLNLHVAQKSFEELVRTATGQAGGPAGIALAGIQGATKAGLGRSGQNFNASGLTTDENLRRGIATFGSSDQVTAITGGKVISRLSDISGLEPNQGAEVRALIGSLPMIDSVKNALGPEAIMAAQRYMEALPPGVDPDYNEISRLMSAAHPLVEEDVLAQILNREYGQNLTGAEAMVFAAKVIVGSVLTQRGAAPGQRGYSKVDKKGNITKDKVTDGFNQARDVADAAAAASAFRATGPQSYAHRIPGSRVTAGHMVGASDELAALAKKLGYKGDLTRSAISGATNYRHGAFAVPGAPGTWTKSRMTQAEALDLQMFQASGMSLSADLVHALGTGGKRTFTVQDAQGNDKEVDLTSLMTNYRDQAFNGTARVASGTDKGTLLSKLGGGPGIGGVGGGKGAGVTGVLTINGSDQLLKALGIPGSIPLQAANVPDQSGPSVADGSLPPGQSSPPGQTSYRWGGR